MQYRRAISTISNNIMQMPQASNGHHRSQGSARLSLQFPSGLYQQCHTACHAASRTPYAGLPFLSISHQGATNSATRHKSRCHIGPYHTAFLTPYVGLPFLSTSPQGTISCHIPSDSCNALNVCRAQMITSIIQHRACMQINTSAGVEHIIQSISEPHVHQPNRHGS